MQPPFLTRLRLSINLKVLFKHKLELDEKPLQEVMIY